MQNKNGESRFIMQAYFEGQDALQLRSPLQLDTLGDKCRSRCRLQNQSNTSLYLLYFYQGPHGCKQLGTHQHSQQRLRRHS